MRNAMSDLVLRKEQGAQSSSLRRIITSCSVLRAPLLAGFLFVAAALPVRLSAQVAAADSALYKLTVSRDSLQALLTALDSTAVSPDSAAAVKARAKVLAGQIRSRLERGDFNPGDRINLQVDSEPQLNDTFPVGPNQELVLPVVGVIPLRGVLRAELQSAMARELSRMLRDPIVRATALIRVSVVGEVVKPGFYLVPPTAVVSDALTAASGPTQNAAVEKMYVERAGRRLIEGQRFQQVIAEGRTLDDADIRPGDKIVVPSARTGSMFETVRTISIILSIPLTIYALTKVFQK
jgi:protein involved in polysaccharide export with SLBB domain